MRKAVSLLVALAVVLISSMPMAPAVLACTGMPAHATGSMEPGSMGQNSMHENSMHQGSMHEGMAAAAQLAAQQIDRAADHACIECGCGCHADIDSLPHMLAPHSTDMALFDAVVAHERAHAPALPALEARALAVFSPPPQSA